MNKYQFFALTQNSFDRLRKSKKNYDLHPSNLVSQSKNVIIQIKLKQDLELHLIIQVKAFILTKIIHKRI